MDDDLEKYQTGLPGKYKQNLELLLAAKTQTNDKAMHLALGLCKQTLFSGMPCQPLPVPSLFTMDIMHLSILNKPDMFVKLITGKLDVYEPDDRTSWDWVIFYHNPMLWSAHGEMISRAVSSHRALGTLPETHRRKLTLGTKLGSFNSTSMVCVQHC